MKDYESTKIHLCDSCQDSDSYPECTDGLGPDDIEFGDGIGLDNIIKCPCYQGDMG